MHQANFKTKNNKFKKIFINVLLIFACCLFYQNSSATHVMGSQITYEHIDSLKYKIIIKVYRDCRGIPLHKPLPTTLSCASGTSTPISITPKRISIRDITPICNKDTNKNYACGKLNVRAARGIEEHVFVDTINFNDSIFKPLLKCSPTCSILIEISQCCRNTAINTGPSGNYYSFAMLNPCLARKNSSPQLNTEPIGFLCCNRPVFYNISGFDNIDDDSVSFSFAKPLIAKGSTVTYSSQRSYKRPFKDYDPSGTGYTNPNVYPPLGTSLNINTGDIIFTPTKCDEVTCYVIEIKEWRKDTSGKYKHIGTVRRDMMFWVQSCPRNNPPSIIKPFSHYASESDTLCFKIKSEDKPNGVPGQPLPPKDTVILTWDNGIKNASFKIINDTVIQQSAEFCWAPPIGSARPGPYYFTVQARDDACPINSVSSRAFEIKVEKKPTTEVENTALSCHYFQLSSTVPDTFKKIATYHWQVLDTGGKVITDTSSVKFNNQTSMSKQAKDSLKIDSFGVFVIKHTIEYPTHHFPGIYLDTIYIRSDSTPTNVKINKISCQLFEVRSNIKDTIYDQASYFWELLDTSGKVISDKKTMHFLSNKDSNSKKQIDTFRLNKTGIYILHHKVKDLPSRCETEYFDTIVFNSIVRADLELTVDTLVCYNNDTFKLIGQGSSKEPIQNYDWFVNDTQYLSQDSFSIKIQNPYSRVIVEATDTNLCYVQDTFLIYNVPAPNGQIIPPYYLCNDTLTLKTNNSKPSPFSKPQFTWSDKSKLDSLNVFKVGKYSVIVQDICGSDTSSVFVFDSSRTFNANEVLHKCLKDTAIAKAAIDSLQYYWFHNKSTNQYQELIKHGEYPYAMILPCGDSIFDKKIVISDTFPRITLPQNKFICDDDSLLVKMDTLSQLTNYLWDNADTASKRYIKNEGKYYLTTTNLCGSHSDTFFVKHDTIPNPSLGNDTSFCAGGFINFKISNYSKYSSHQWHNGSRRNGYTAYSSANVVLTITNFCGTKSDTVIALRDSPPAVVLPKDSIACVNDSINLSAGSHSKFTKYSWNTGSKNGSIKAYKKGWYYVTAKNLCGADTDSFYLDFDDSISIKLPQDTVLCFGDSFTYTPRFKHSKYSSFKWENGDTSITRKFYSFPKTFKLTSKNVCGITSDSFIVFEQYKPTLFLRGDTSICLGDSIKVTAKVNPLQSKIRWNNGDSSSFLWVKNDGKYIANTQNVCGFASDSFTLKTVNVTAKKFQFTINGLKTEFKINNADSTLKYSWDFGDSKSGSGDTINHVYSKSGNYNVCLTTKDSLGCFAIFCDSVSPGNCNAKFSAVKDTFTKFSIRVIDASTGSNLSYLWTFGDGDSSTLQKPKHHYKTYGKYQLCLKVNNKNCQSTYCDSIGLDSTGKMLKSDGFWINVIDSAQLGVKSIEESSVNVYPVPSEGVVFVEFDEYFSKSNIAIFSPNGQRINIYQSKLDSGLYRYDFSDKPNGTYTLRIKTEKGVLTKFIIIQR